MIKTYCSCGSPLVRIENCDECDNTVIMPILFTIGKKYRIPTWRDDYFIYFTVDCDDPLMEDGTKALMNGWKSIIHNFEEVSC